MAYNLYMYTYTIYTMYIIVAIHRLVNFWCSLLNFFDFRRNVLSFIEHPVFANSRFGVWFISQLVPPGPNFDSATVGECWGGSTTATTNALINVTPPTTQQWTWKWEHFFFSTTTKQQQQQQYSWREKFSIFHFPPN